VNKVEAILIDFDGTIIDSYPGIQKAFDTAYQKLYSVSSNVSIRDLIGPPINEILVKATGEKDPNKIETFVKYFKEYYDTEGFKASVLYSGTEEVLQALVKKGIRLFVVTNKRFRPTQLIAKYLNIERYFCAFYCGDAKEGYASKSEMVSHLLCIENVQANNCILIGDTEQDEKSAKQNGIPFIYAAFGYGSLSGIENQISEPLDALKFI
jgi:phosphoglycolate phosphatase